MKGARLIILFIALVLVTGFVIAQDFGDDIARVSGNAGDGFSEFFQNFLQGFQGQDKSFTKVIFFIIVSLFIYELLGFVIKNQFIGFVVALLIGFLSTAFITPDEIFSILITYQALGVTLSSIIPFIVLAGLTFKASKEEAAGLYVVQLLAWIIFTVYVMSRAAALLFVDIGGNDGLVNIILFGTALLCLIMVFANKFIVNKLSDINLDAEGQSVARKHDRARKSIEQHAKDFKSESS